MIDTSSKIPEGQVYGKKKMREIEKALAPCANRGGRASSAAITESGHRRKLMGAGARGPEKGKKDEGRGSLLGGLIYSGTEEGSCAVS